MITFNFSNKVALVGGGASGIGYATVDAFLKAGAQVVMIGRSEEKLVAAKQQLQAAHGKQIPLLSIAADLSNQTDVRSVAQQAQTQFGGIDFLINSAAIWSLTPLSDLNDDLLQSYFNNNLKTVIYGTQMAQQYLRAGGAIVNLGSFAAIMPRLHSSIYASFKTAINTFTRSSAAELAPASIRVNCVIPGVIRTPMSNDFINTNYAKVTEPIPLKRVGEAYEIANSILFLCSDAASYITGAILEVTGGKYITQI